MSTETHVGRITASADNIELGRVACPTACDGHIRTIGGTALLSESGEPRATMSFLAMKRYWGYSYLDNTADKRPLMVVMNGGPSAPSTQWNLQTLTGPYHVSHGFDGHLSMTHHPVRVNQTFDSPVNGTDVLHIDPVGTGLGRVVAGVDPDWAYNSETDAENTAALTAMYLQEFGNGRDEANLVGSSFFGLRGAMVANKLMKRGINVIGMAIMSGAYDYGIINYDDPENYRAFINALPAIAVAARFHSRPKPEYWWQEREPIEEARDEALFDRVRSFADGEYAEALQSDSLKTKRRNAVVQKIAELTGLTYDLVEEQDLRISPYWYAQNFLPGKTLSVIDSRLAFPSGDFYIDPALDTWDQVYRKSFTSGHLANGYPKSFAHGYQGTIKIPQWRFNGLVAERTAHAAMLQIIENNPKIAINVFNGFYDLNMPPPSTEIFWKEIRELCGIRLRQYRSHTVDINDTLIQTQGVHSFLLPTGHQLTSPYLHGVRQVVSQMISRMSSYKPN